MYDNKEGGVAGIRVVVDMSVRGLCMDGVTKPTNIEMDNHEAS